MVSRDRNELGGIPSADAPVETSRVDSFAEDIKKAQILRSRLLVIMVAGTEMIRPALRWRHLVSTVLLKT